jgi:REP-associated tyrosine transposase
MPRPPRDLAPGFHHVWVNATGRELYFRDPVDRMVWIRRLLRTLHAYQWTCVAFCQLDSHVHLLLEVPDGSLALGMKQLNVEYSKEFNARHDRSGQFVRGRYGSRRIADGDDLIATYAYVVLNAVAAGLAWQPEDWRWSSFATTLGRSADFAFVDASAAIAEAGGSVDALWKAVSSRLRARLAWPDRPRPVSDTGRGRAGQVSRP